MTVPQHENVTIREVYALLETVKAEAGRMNDGLRAEMKEGFAHHERRHIAEDRSRVAKQRWIVGISLTMGGIIGGAMNDLIGKIFR